MWTQKFHIRTRVTKSGSWDWFSNLYYIPFNNIEYVVFCGVLLGQDFDRHSCRPVCVSFCYNLFAHEEKMRGINSKHQILML